MDPSERRMPVPATASCMIPLARSAAGCSIDWYGAAMPQGRAVVVGAVVQSADPARRGERELRDGRAAVGTEDDLRRLDLHLEPKSSLRQAVHPLEGSHRIRHRLDLRDRAHLGQGERQPGGQLAALEEGAHEQVERAQATCARGRLEGFEPDADERRGHATADGVRDPLGGEHGIGILGLVAAIAVHVLEVEAEVLDGLARELLLHQRCDERGELRVEADAHGERLDASRGVGGTLCGCTPAARQLGREGVGGHVDGVHGLARAVVAGVGRREQPVARLQARRRCRRDRRRSARSAARLSSAAHRRAG